MARSKANRRGAAAQKKKAIAPGKLSTVSLQDLHAEGEVWQCIMGHLVADRTALYCLGFSARFLWESVLKMPVATLQDDTGETVLRSALYFDETECVYLDYARRLLDSLDLKAQEYDTTGGDASEKAELVQFDEQCRNLRQEHEAPTPSGEKTVIVVHQTLHFVNRAQVDRKLSELSEELQKAGVSTQVGSGGGGGGAVSEQKAKPARSSKRTAVRQSSERFLAADAEPKALTVKQLQQALLDEAGIANAKGSKPQLVAQLEVIREQTQGGSASQARSLARQASLEPQAQPPPANTAAKKSGGAAKALRAGGQATRAPGKTQAKGNSRKGGVVVAGASKSSKKRKPPAAAAGAATGKQLRGSASHGLDTTVAAAAAAAPAVGEEGAGVDLSTRSISGLMAMCDARGIDHMEQCFIDKDEFVAAIASHTRDLAAEMRGQSLAALKAQCLRCKLPQTGDKEALVERLNGQKQMVFEATVGAKLRV